MASRIKSKLWYVRADGPESFLRQKCIELSQSLDTVSLLAAFHKGKTGENPHCHFVIEIASDIQKQSIDVRFKKLFEIIKSKDYCSKVWDGNRGKGAVSYLFHEDDERILARKDFTDEDILRAREANAAVQAVVALNKEKASVKLVDRARDHFRGSVYRPGLKMDVLMWMLAECRSGNSYYPGSFLLKKYVEEVELSCLDASDMDAFAFRLYGQLWRD